MPATAEEHAMKRKGFEHFYLTKVALGDCCGDAERVINLYDIDRMSAERHLSRPGRALGLRSLLKFLRRMIGHAIRR